MNEEENKDVSTDDGMSGKELYEMKKQERDAEKGKGDGQASEAVKSGAKSIIGTIVVLLVLGGLGAGFVWFATNQLYLPPITAQGHVETSPAAHILDTPIPDKVQRHMFEHSDGSGKPGIIIQYNCKDYDCAPDLIANLTALVEEFPDNVYLAPNNYDGKIILTKRGSYEILESFDDAAIRAFIR